MISNSPIGGIVSDNRSIEERFYPRLAERPNGCLEWTGCTDHKYGSLKVYKVAWRAHRLAWALAYGDIPTGMLVLHTCDNPPCCNPAHLFLGTQSENMKDKVNKGRQGTNRNRDKTHCKNGHEFTPENTFLKSSASRGFRECRTCRRERKKVKPPQI